MQSFRLFKRGLIKIMIREAAKNIQRGGPSISRHLAAKSWPHPKMTSNLLCDPPYNRLKNTEKYPISDNFRGGPESFHKI